MVVQIELPKLHKFWMIVVQLQAKIVLYLWVSNANVWWLILLLEKRKKIIHIVSVRIYVYLRVFENFNNKVVSFCLLFKNNCWLYGISVFLEISYLLLWSTVQKAKNSLMTILIFRGCPLFGIILECWFNPWDDWR